MTLKKELVIENYKEIEKMIKNGDREFYVALCICDIADMDIKNIDEKLINLIYKAIEEKESLYSEYVRDDINEVKEKIDKEELLELFDKYCEKCTNKEWKYLLNKYCISDEENYMGEVRRNLEEAISEEFDLASVDERVETLHFFSKYEPKSKENIKLDYDLEEIEM